MCNPKKKRKKKKIMAVGKNVQLISSMQPSTQFQTPQRMATGQSKQMQQKRVSPLKSLASLASQDTTTTTSSELIDENQVLDSCSSISNLLNRCAAARREQLTQLEISQLLMSTFHRLQRRKRKDDLKNETQCAGWMKNLFSPKKLQEKGLSSEQILQSGKLSFDLKLAQNTTKNYVPLEIVTLITKSKLKRAFKVSRPLSPIPNKNKS